VPSLPSSPRGHHRSGAGHDVHLLALPGRRGARHHLLRFPAREELRQAAVPERLAELRRYAPSVRCSACGAPIDLARESLCGHCRAPLSMLDPDQVETMVRDLQRAEARRTTIDPTFAVRLIADRAAI
jgi:hypothetical protein